MSDTCKSCGQRLPVTCDRCQRTFPAHQMMKMRHKTTGKFVEWCGSCYGAWLQAKEIAEYETSGVVR